MASLESIENMLEFLIKENLRLNGRIINLCSVLSDHLEFTDKEEDIILNPDVDYREEESIIKKLKIE